ncbi:MAG: hypothetical protein ACRDK1_05710 [Solirubrobacterales bacterium]
MIRIQDLERSEAIRWIDLNAEALTGSEAMALLDPICRGQLDGELARRLVEPGRATRNGSRPRGGPELRASFRIRHLTAANTGQAWLFEPVRLLVGEDWLISCWLEPRLFRGMGVGIDRPPDDSAEIFLTAASAWLREGASTASDLADLVQRQLDRDHAPSSPD